MRITENIRKPQLGDLILNFSECVLFGIVNPTKRLSVFKALQRTILSLASIIFMIMPLPCFGDDAKLELNSEEIAWIEEENIVRVRIGSAPPLMITDGEIRGIAIDYLTYIFNRNGIKFTYVQDSEVTWPEALKYIEQHEVVDMVPTAKITEERKNHMLFTNEYIIAPWVIFTRSDADFVSSLDDLKGKTVSVKEGYVIQELLEREYPEIKLRVVSAKLDNYAEIPIHDLSTGLVDAYIGNLLITTYMIQTKGYSNIKVAAPTSFDNHNQAMAIRNDWPELTSIINKTLAAMTSDEHAAILSKWLSIRYEYGISKFDLLKWGLGISIIASLFIIFVLIWNKRLKTEVVFREKTEKILNENLLLLDHTNDDLKKKNAELKNAKESIDISDSRFRELVNTINSGVAIYKVINDGKSGSDYIIKEFNKFALTHENKLKEDVIGKSLKDIRPNIDDFGLIDVFRKVWKSGQAEFFPAQVYIDDNYTNYYENRIFKLPGGEIVAVYDDVTEKKLVEETLLVNQKRYKDAQSIGHVGNWEYDPVTSKFWASDEARRIYGFDLERKDFSTEKVESCIPERERVHQALTDLIEHDKKYDLIFDILTVDKGIRKTIHSIAEMERDALGNPSKISGLIHDITEQKKTEEEKTELQEQLNHRSKMDAIGELAGGMAHDFNNVLSGILSASELLRLPKQGLNEKSLRYVDMVIQASIRASDLISKLLAFSRRGKIVTTTLDIHKILNDAADILEGTIDKKITVSVTEDALNHKFIGDLSGIENALINLGINASHAMPNGGVIQFKTRNVFLDQRYCDSSPFDIIPGEFLQIEVKDSGFGIPEENMHKIFEPFFTTKEQGKGTGLGLSAVYGTIQDHHGVIEVFSVIGSGATFNILLPCSEELTEEEKKESPIITGSGTILIVDDEEMNRILIQDILESLGYRVLIAEDGLKSIEIFSDCYPEIDIILLDMIMPKMNGSETFFKMKEIDENCKVIITSGYTQDESIDELIKNGLAGFIKKPYSISDISQILEKVDNKPQ